MKIFSDLCVLIRLEQFHLPFIESLEDREIAVQIGFHEFTGNEPLTLKHLFLLDVGSMATVQRRLTRLVDMGIVVKRRHKQDRRLFTLHLSSDTKARYLKMQAALPI